VGTAAPFLAPPPLLTYSVRGEWRVEERSREGSGTGTAGGSARRSTERRVREREGGGAG
jgi:hypothetical protein